jgi:hypothetical protein
MKIKFFASLQGAGCIRIDDDNSANVKLTCDGGQIASVVQLLSLQGKAFPVVIDTNEAK